MDQWIHEYMNIYLTHLTPHSWDLIRIKLIHQQFLSNQLETTWFFFFQKPARLTHVIHVSTLCSTHISMPNEHWLRSCKFALLCWITTGVHVWIPSSQLYCTITTTTPMNYHNSLSHTHVRLNWYSFVLYRLGMNATEIHVHVSAVVKPVYYLRHCIRHSTKKRSIFQWWLIATRKDCSSKFPCTCKISIWSLTYIHYD